MTDLKNLGLPENIFRYFRVSFHDLLYIKKQAAAGFSSSSYGTLRMMSNNRRSAPAINDHLPIEEASGEYSSDRKKLGKLAAIILQVTSGSIFSSGE